MTAPVSRLTKQAQVQKKRNPDGVEAAPKVDENCERFEKNQCIGITRGGRNTKIHAVVDGKRQIYPRWHSALTVSFQGIRDSR